MSDLEGEGEHLELDFGEVDPEDLQKRAIKPNRKYGTMLRATTSKRGTPRRKRNAAGRKKKGGTRRGGKKNSRA